MPISDKYKVPIPLLMHIDFYYISQVLVVYIKVLCVEHFVKLLDIVVNHPSIEIYILVYFYIQLPKLFKSSMYLRTTDDFPK